MWIDAVRAKRNKFQILSDLDQNVQYSLLNVTAKISHRERQTSTKTDENTLQYLKDLHLGSETEA